MFGTPRFLSVSLLAAALVGWCASPCPAQLKAPGKGNPGGVVGTPTNPGGGIVGTPTKPGTGILGTPGQNNQGNQGNVGQNGGTPGQGQWWQNGVPLPIYTGTFLGRQMTTLEVYDNLAARLQFHYAVLNGAFQNGFGGGQFGGNFGGQFGQFGGNFGQFGGNPFVGGQFSGNFGQFGGNPFAGGQFAGNPLMGGQFAGNPFAGGQFAGNPWGPQAVAGYVGGATGFNFAQPPFGGGLLGNPGLGFVGNR